ncbi:MAG: hypothetical protein F6K32_04635 [Desertifilum sp. SIO1I2]|nr:hypothetical protein [Desertifilum sp. SIO1I2]
MLEPNQGYHLKKFILSQLQNMKSVAIGKHIAPWSLAVVVGLSGGVWTLGTAVAPQPARAYTARASVTITRTGGESYQTLLQRAEAAARAAAQRTFDTDLLATDVSIMIVAQNNGASVPILTLEATRPQWSRRPDPQAWATYLPNAEMLLGFSTPESPAAAQPAAPLSPQPGVVPGQVVVPFPGQAEGIQIQPGAIPVQPGVIPVQPGVIPVQPGVIPVQPGVIPVQPGAIPVQPSGVPLQPGQVVPQQVQPGQAVPQQLQPGQVAPQQVQPGQAVPQQVPQAVPQAPQQIIPSQNQPTPGAGGLVCQGGVCRPAQ